ncbi:ALA-interacting subunit 1-like [Wolffia australiana]
MEFSEERRHPNKPKYSKFTQQELSAYKPLLSPGWIISTFGFIGLVFIPVGLASLFASQRVVEIVERYDEACVLGKLRVDQLAYIQNSAVDKKCIRKLKVPTLMRGPIFVYYELENFYQNHRRYVMSRSDKQLRNKEDESDTKSCGPEAKTSDGLPIVPCGLIAWSMFNDTYAFSLDGKTLKVSKKDIAWGSDKYYKFGSNVYPENFQTSGLIGGAKLDSSIPLREQEDLMVWMRTAALPTFRKLYGKIEADLKANVEITVTIQNNYNTYSFGGKKRLVLSTTTWIGGKNDFLGMAYLTVGGLSFLLALTFILLHLIRPRPLGDPSYLSWNRKKVGNSD